MDDSDSSSSYGDIPTRPMRVKVLYSFDSDNKTNCLARFPKTMQIPAVAIDENSQVGVIELKQCLQAIVGASPDLISRLSNGDFTIYAYDYSEYETPLVGQGMLSTVLTSSPPVDEEKNMITGRVCKNLPALFSNGVKETLEVKLRLVPVPKTQQSAMVNNMDLRGLSPAMSGGFDPNAWNASMHQQWPSQSHSNESFSMDSTNNSLVDDIFGLGVEMSGDHLGTDGVGADQTPRGNSFAFNPAFNADSHSAPGSRSGSPMIRPDSSARNDLLRHQSFSGNIQDSSDQYRPGSRASARGESNMSRHQRQGSAQLSQTQQQQNETYYNEDNQPRKRAKVMQADWRGKASFGSKSSDLRVTAATAASMHMHRPIPKKSNAPGADLEPPPRVPTPVPQRSRMLPQGRVQSQATSRSMLRQASTAGSDMMSDFDQMSDAVMSSPEEESPTNSMTAEGTPMDIPSSPPIFPGINQPTPSSPGLPTLPPPRIADSGYMSSDRNNNGGLDNFDDDDTLTFIKTEGSVSGHYRDPTPGEMSVNMETPGDMNQLPHKMRLDMSASRQRSGSQGVRHSKSTTSRPATLDRSQTAPIGEDQGTKLEPPSRRNSLALPPFPGSFSNQSQSKSAPKRKSMQRSQTYNESEAGSPAPSDCEGGMRGPKRSGSGAPRRVVIQERLQMAIANNVMPQYCNHCGAIETPTWRKLYCKYVDGKPGVLDSVEGEGETIGVEELEKDDNDVVTRFVIRKSMKKTKDQTPGAGFETMQVCNPCGLWFQKYRNMRPPEKWARKSTTRKSKKRPADDGSCPATDGPEFQSEAFFTDQIIPEEDGEEIEPMPVAPVQRPTEQVRPQPQPVQRKPRASSVQPTAMRRTSSNEKWNATRLNTALSREIQSSPVRHFGSQASPIEIDETTPKPTRRILFPSPRKDGEMKSLDDNGQATLNATPPNQSLLSPKDAINAANTDMNIYSALEKENISPHVDIDDSFAGLFDGSPGNTFKTPSYKTPTKTTPRSTRQTTNNLLKTPTPKSRDRKHLTPNLNAANASETLHTATGAAHDFMTSPASSRYFLRSTPSRQERTPGRASDGGDRSSGVSPFSRHLAQMLSDANDSNAAAFTSPTRAFDFSDLPTFTTPGRTIDWASMEDILSSEFGAFDEGG